MKLVKILETVSLYFTLELKNLRDQETLNEWKHYKEFYIAFDRHPFVIYQNLHQTNSKLKNLDTFKSRDSWFTVVYFVEKFKMSMMVNSIAYLYTALEKTCDRKFSWHGFHMNFKGPCDFMVMANL